MKWRILELRDIDIYTLHAMEEVLYTQPSQDSILILSKVRPGLSLANNESYLLDVDDVLCKQEHVNVTRRKTGGRSMYLDDNYLILSIISRGHNPHQIDLPKQYQNTVGKINEALKSVVGKDFTLKADNDIMVEGKKVGGAAVRNISDVHFVHCYIRVNDDLHKMLRYVMIDGHKLDRYYDELRQNLACIRDFKYTDNFYGDFKHALIKNLEHYQSELSHNELSIIREAAEFYKNRDYIVGGPNLPSKGNCDIIEGSGKNAKLKIKSLEGLVRYS